MNKVQRIYHTWDKWECFHCHFYESSKDGWTKKQCEEYYRDLLSDLPRFEKALLKVITTWKHSCEHYLTNENMNRIAWLGQASAAIENQIPSAFRSGYFLLTKEQQKIADLTALKFLNIWLKNNNYQEVDLVGAGVTSKANLY